MTLNELFSETSALCFDDLGGIDPSFIFTANRALVRVVSELAPSSRAAFAVTGISAVSTTEKYVHLPGARQELKLSGAAFSFCAVGTGKYSITKNGETYERGFSGKRCICREFIPGEAAITFFGDSAFMVTSLSSFAVIYGEREEDIPLYSETCEYRLSDYVSDIFRITAPPLGDDGAPLRGAYISADKLSLPSNYSGNVYIEYRRLPKRITLDDGDKELDTDAPLAYLLPILCAAYVLLDTDEEKALYYMRMYESEAARLRVAYSADIGGEYRDVTGWA